MAPGSRPSAFLPPARLALPAALLVAATLAAYLPALRCAFTNFDDDEFVTRNSAVLAGFGVAGVRWALTAFHAGNWMPLTWLSHALDVSLFGLAPWGHHLVNVLLHVANTLLVFLVLRSMTGAAGRSLAAAALFGLHPLRVESVAWVAERKDVLSAFFFLLAVGAHLRYARRPSAKRALATAAAAALALLAKPMAVTLPAALLLLDFWPLGRLRAGGARPAGVLLEKLPLVALAGAAGLITVAAQSRGGTIAGLASHPLSARLLNAPLGYAGYLADALWPAGLAPYYPLVPAQLSLVRAAAALAPLAAATVLAAVARRGQPWLLAGWLWFLGTLLPVIGLIQVGIQARADRYTYLPSLGLAVVAVWGGQRALRGRGAAPAGLVSLALAAATVLQIGFWRDGVTLMTRATDVASAAARGALPPDAWTLFGKLGSAYGERGEHGRAVWAYEQALALNPGAAQGHYNLGNELSALGRLADAATSFRAAVALQPDFADAWYNLGNTCLLLGLGEESRRAFERAAILDRAAGAGR